MDRQADTRLDRRTMILGAVLVGASALTPVMGDPETQINPETQASPEIRIERVWGEPAESNDPDVGFANRLSRAFERAAARIEPSVVHVTSAEQMRQYQRDRFGRRVGSAQTIERPAGLGSGVIVDDMGHIVTNAHVITVDERTRNYGDRLVVRLNDGREYDAELVGADPASDIAVLRVDAEGLIPAAWGDSEAARVGQWVLAVGSPFGFDQTVTAGIVSSKARPPLTADRDVGFDPMRFQEFIQTDAAINPGNSGGPLVDLGGRIVGINTAIASRSGGNNGLGFAIPSDLARSVAERLIQTGRVDRGYLGVEWDLDNPTIDPQLSRRLGVAGGVRIAAVSPGGPADRAGLEPGDVIVGFGGRTTENANRLRNAIAITPPGAEVEIDYFRGERSRTARARVVDRQTGIAMSRNATVISGLGMVVQETRLTLANRRGRTERPGLVIMDVLSGSPADAAGLTTGDVLLEAGARTLDDVEDLERVVERGDLRDGVTFRLFRPGTGGRGGLLGEVEIRAEP